MGCCDHVSVRIKVRVRVGRRDKTSLENTRQDTIRETQHMTTQDKDKDKDNDKDKDGIKTKTG